LTMLVLLFLGYDKDRQLFIIFNLYCVLMVYQQRFTIRPDIFSLFFFSLYIYILALHIDKKWSVAALFILQILWTNIHGFFFFGPVFILIGLASEWIKRHVPLPYEWNDSGRLTDEEYGRLKLTAILVFLACFLNPHFIKGALYPLGVFFSLSGENKIFFEYIQELQRPIANFSAFFVSDEFAYYKLLIFLSFVSFVFNRRRIDVSALLFWIVFLIFSLKAARNLSFFAFAAYLVIITNTLHLSVNDIVPLRFTGEKFKHLTSAVVKFLLIIYFFQYGQSLAGRGYFDFDKGVIKSEFGGISLRAYPTKAVDFLVEHEVKGNFLNDFNSGAYLIGHTFPNIKVYIDGRTEVYGGDFFKRYKKIYEKGNKKYLEEDLAKYEITGVFLNSSRQHIPKKILNYFYKHKDWISIYFDFDGMIFLKDIPMNQELIKTQRVELKDFKGQEADLYKLATTRVKPYRYFYRAFTLEQLGLDDAAFVEAKEALKITPGYADPYNLIGKIYTKRADYLEAFNNFRWAVLFSPNKKDMRHNLALAYLDLEEYEGAVKQYKTIIEIWPNDPKGYFYLSKAFAHNNQFSESYDTLLYAVKLNPKDVVDIMKIGDLIFEQAKYEESLKVYTVALSTNKDLSNIHKKIGMSLKALGKMTQAITAFQKALKEDPENEGAKKLLEELTINDLKS